jgi:hypothetical protein
MNYRILLSLVIAIFASACTTLTERINQRVAAIPESARAYLVGTYSVDCEGDERSCGHVFNSISVYYRKADEPEIRGRLNWTRGSMFGGNTAHDYIDVKKGQKGQYFCVALPAGDYEFFSYDFYNFAGGGSGYSIPERSQFKVPVSLAAGEVVNVGKLHVTTGYGKNIFGMSLPAPGILLLQAGNSASAASGQAKCPENVRGRAVRTVQLKPVAPTPLVRVDVESVSR